jgi:hypothetical protein
VTQRARASQTQGEDIRWEDLGIDLYDMETGAEGKRE